jgi:hypothetical protein
MMFIPIRRSDPQQSDEKPKRWERKTLAHDHDREEIVRRIGNVCEVDRRRWGRMSVHQMLCHVADGFRVGLGERTVSPATGYLQRTLIKWIALRVPVQWVRGYPTRPELEQGKGGSAPVAFNEDREQTASLVNRFSSEMTELGPPHPVFGPMTRDEWLRWGYLHADHHLRQFGR